MSARGRARYIATTVVAVVGTPVACLASLAIAVVPLLVAYWLLDAARSWS